MLDRTATIDVDVVRCALVAAGGPFQVVVDQRLGLRVISGNPLAHRLFAVVGPLHQGLCGDVVLARNLLRLELDMVAAAGSGMHPSAAHAAQNFAVADFDLDHVVDVYAFALHGFRLRDGAREAVDKISPGGVRLTNAILYQPYDDIIRNELAGVHEFFRLQAERMADANRLAQHVTGGDLRDAVLLGDELRLRTFARAG